MLLSQSEQRVESTGFATVFGIPLRHLCALANGSDLLQQEVHLDASGMRLPAQTLQ
jgi:hypothetical protein